MGQRTRILTQIAGFRGWKVAETRWENEAGQTIEPFADYVPADAILVLVVARRWAARCPKCLAICSGSPHENCKTRQWADLPWAGHRPPSRRISHPQIPLNRRLRSTVTDSLDSHEYSPRISPKSLNNIPRSM